MTYKNPKELLDAATALPAAIEAKLPSGAPKISSKLLQFDSNVVSKLPDFLIAAPDLPPIPALPNLPAAPAGLRRYVTGAEVIPTAPPAPSARGKVTYHSAPNSARGTLNYSGD